jgi:hypothetical protein
MCGGVDHGEHNPVPVLLLRNPQAEEPAQPNFAPRPASVAAPVEMKAPASRKSRKLWELKRSLHCPVIGTCLDIDVWRRLARVQGLAVEEMSDYDVHVHFVGACGARNTLSLAAQKALDRAHSSLVGRFARARSREDLEALWQRTLNEGEVPGGFWAFVTHPLCDPGLTNRAYEDIHMLSHQIGAGQRADLKQLRDARLEVQRLRREADEQQRRHQQSIGRRDRRLAELESELAELREEVRTAKARETGALQRLADLANTRPREGLAVIAKRAQAAERRAEKLRSELRAWQEACELANTRADAWEREYQEQHAQREALERLLLQNSAGCSGCSASSSFTCTNLCGRRILCVGGRSHVIDHYREIVARCNGEFDHHDGGIEDKPQRLNALLSSADVVICAIDCVSHDAYNRSKRFCKRFAKPCVLLRSSGVSTFARALEQVAAQSRDAQPHPASGPPESAPPLVMLGSPE